MADQRSPSAVLAEAARLIQECGWRPSVAPEDGRLELREALAAGITGLPSRPIRQESPEWGLYISARAACLAVTGWQGLLYRWADEPGRTQTDVLAMLVLAADHAAGGEPR